MSKRLRIADYEPTVYISGKMTGIPEYNFPKFNYYANMFRALKWKVMNPAEHHKHTDKSWFWYITEDLKWIEKEQPQFFFMLNGWEDSHGAIIERTAGIKIGAIILYEQHFNFR